MTGLQTEITGKSKYRDGWARAKRQARHGLTMTPCSPNKNVMGVVTTPMRDFLHPGNLSPASGLQRHEAKPVRKGQKTFGSVRFGWSQNEQHGTSDFPGRSFLATSQRRCRCLSCLPFTSGAAGPQESAGALRALLLPAMARVATTAVFTGFVWELGVGLGNSWEFLSNCIP